MKVLFISTWKSACGIATYSKNLIDELEKIGIRCEVFSDTTNFSALTKLAKDSTADVVHIQHEFGISVINEALISLISKFRTAGKAVVITPHTEMDYFNVLLDGVADVVIQHNDFRNLYTKNMFSLFKKVPHGVPDVTLPLSKEAYKTKYDMNGFVIGTCGFLSNERSIFVENLIKELAPFIGEHKDIFVNISTSSHRADIDGSFANSVKSSLGTIAEKFGFDKRFYVNSKFLDTQEFRERIATMDLGFARANPNVISNSGAAADLISMGVPVIVNNVNHFSHLSNYVTHVEDNITAFAAKIKEMYLNRNLLQEAQEKTKLAVKEIGYPVIARQHKELYEKAINHRNSVVKVLPNRATLDKNKPITITIPNSFWQALMLYAKLYPLIKEGYVLKFVVQNDGLYDIKLLEHMCRGVIGVDFADIGMVKDSKVYKLNSKVLSNNMSIDLESFFKDGNTFGDIFGVKYDYIFPELNVGTYNDEHIRLASGRQLVDLDTVNVTDLTSVIGVCSPIFGTNIKRYDYALGYEGKIITADIRTRLAMVIECESLVANWGDLDCFNLLFCTGKPLEHYSVSTTEFINSFNPYTNG